MFKKKGPKHLVKMYVKMACTCLSQTDRYLHLFVDTCQIKNFSTHENEKPLWINSAISSLSQISFMQQLYDNTIFAWYLWIVHVTSFSFIHWNRLKNILIKDILNQIVFLTVFYRVELRDPIFRLWIVRSWEIFKTFFACDRALKWCCAIYYLHALHPDER